LEWGYDIIVWLQQFSPALDALFKAITTLGAEQAFLLLLPLIFWCVDKRQGARLSVLLMLSAYLNYALKDLFGQPRPSPERVKVLAEETSPGLPSGHSQNSVAVYGYLATQLRRPRAWVIAGWAALAVGVSRIYLGVHFASDVLVGWLVGMAVLLLYLRVEPDVEYYVRPWPTSRKMALAVIAPLALFLIYANESSAQLMGTLVGLLAGLLVEVRRVGFSVQGPLWQRAARFAVGGVVLVGLWLGTRAIFPAGLAWRFLRYALVGAWASLGAPWLFVQLNLVPREREAWE
jgi:hypothetical protein